MKKKIKMKKKIEWVVGYGSLLWDYRHALEREAVLVQVPGWKRIYNCAAYLDRYAMAANIVEHERLFFNGLMFPVSQKHLAALDRREVWYDRVQVDVARYDGLATSIRPWVYTAVEGIVAPNSICLPADRDWEMAVRGAEFYGQEFLTDFFKTTFLANERLVVADGPKTVSFLPPRAKKADCTSEG